MCLDEMMYNNLQEWKWKRRGWSELHNWVKKVK